VGLGGEVYYMPTALDSSVCGFRIGYIALNEVQLIFAENALEIIRRTGIG